MPDNQNRKRLLPLTGVLWCLFVVASYFHSNSGYYIEKLSAFGRFTLNLIGRGL